ncbi:MAG TPA: M20/M25/M40 family metallo-hydrolase [Kofleriaceae bacterium]|nr:M20/M25/M40 family metallo-hydrolase [Kofleriaceae bacterium]
MLARLALLALLTGCGGAHPAPAAAAPADGERPARAAPAPGPAAPVAAWFAPAALAADVAWLCAPARAGRGAHQPGGHATADWVAGVFRELGLDVVRQPIGAMPGAENVIGILRGDARAVLVSAHYDHLGRDDDGTVYPGADDNASGVAVLLAIARDLARGARPRHTVLLVAFGAEEEGLLGSGEYIVHPAWPLERTAAVINFDMVGRNFFEAGADQPGAAAIIGSETVDGGRAAVQTAADAAGLKVIAAPAALLDVLGYANRTDDWWFRRRSVPAIHFSTGMHDDYHLPSDTPDRLVPEQMSRIARAAAGLARWLANR